MEEAGTSEILGKLSKVHQEDWKPNMDECYGDSTVKARKTLSEMLNSEVGFVRERK